MPLFLWEAQLLLYERMRQPHASLASGFSAVKWHHSHLRVDAEDAVG